MLNPKRGDLALRFLTEFSRLEFALKENKFLKFHNIGGPALPSWEKFTAQRAEKYIVDPDALQLIASNPKTQVVVKNSELAWQPVDLSKCTSELEKVVLLLKIVRDHFFYGGKYGIEGWRFPS